MAKNKNKSKIIKSKQSRAPTSTKNKRKPTKNKRNSTKKKPKATRTATKKGNKRKLSAWQIFIRQYAAANPNRSQRDLWHDASLEYRRMKSDAYATDNREYTGSDGFTDDDTGGDSDSDIDTDGYTTTSSN